MWAMPYIVEVQEAVDQWGRDHEYVCFTTEERRHWPRKDFALWAQEHYKHNRVLFSLAMLMYGNKVPDDTIVRNYLYGMKDD
jgi:hypothetical protein